MEIFLIFGFLLASAIAFAISTPDTESQALVQRSTPRYSAETYTSPEEAVPDVASDYGLLDVVLVASVDGKFHALNRTSGQVLWSMSSFATTTSVSAPSSLAPLVRTSHVQNQLSFDPDTIDEDTDQETYIIEPQSGDIYVLSNPSSPLQRLPYSMAELVETSPTTNADDTRIFVGRKETSLLLIELETGKIKATLNSECPPIFNWDEKLEIDLDELEEDIPKISAPTEVYIGRTDYHISIYKKPLPGEAAPPPQNLSFSTYGPNNKDNHLQATYRRTKDDSYIQPLHSGDIISFKRENEGETPHVVWGYQFGAPVVAIFDVLHTHHSSHAFVLLQPRPKLQDLFPKLSTSNKPGYVGLVEETGSLFAMSPESYPLVVFAETERERLAGGKSSKETLDAPPKHGYRPDGDSEDQPVPTGTHDVEDNDSLLDRCLRNPYDARCLVGMRQFEEEELQGRKRRLLDAPKAPKSSMQQTMSTSSAPVVIEMQRPRDDNMSTRNSEERETLALPEDRAAERPWHGIGLLGSGNETVWEAVLVSLVFGALSMWFLWKRVRRRVEKVVVAEKERQEQQERKDIAIPEVVEDAVPGPPSEEVGVKKEVPQPLPLPEGPQEPLSPALPITPATATTVLEDGDDSEGEVDAPGTPTPGKRKARRGKRGKKKRGGAASGDGDEKELEKKEEIPVEAPPAPSNLVLTTSSPKPPVVHQPSLIVSDSILGFGSHGTVVFQGSLQGRAVAVKRLLQDFVTLADREVSILQDSDDHPNVIRYYYQESHANFLYIALELCPASLADVIENPNQEQWKDIAINFDPKKALKQITSGLRHLHGLKLIHRDIKPQNILISSAKGGATTNTFGAKNGKGGAYRMLISDFGLCKRLDVDQTSFLPTAHGAMAAGTVGWRAPEILKGEVKLDEFIAEDGSISSRGSVATVHGNASIGSAGSNSSNRPLTRLTKSVDIFALGCLFYYTLTNGGHPYGDRFEREVNIMKNAKDLGILERFGEEGTEATDLIMKMLDPEAKERPDTTTILLHPFFWDAARRLNFLQDASDRFEVMCRDPKDPDLLTLEKGAVGVVSNDWHARLDKIFIDNLGKYRKYDGRSVQDLLRALRNKKHHYQDLPDNVKRHLGPMPEGFLGYFTRRYPQLFLHVHGVIKETGLHSESMFRSYFELPDS